MRSRILLKIILVLCSSAFTLAAVSSLGWYLSATKPTSTETLTSAQRQQLIEDMLSLNPGVFRPAFFDPPIGYTLRPNAENEIWNDSFRANRLGYRTGPPEKAPGTFRIVFVGDSWTYGYGLTEAESFPKVFETIANRYSGVQQQIEAWTLALPGYNTFNELAALWFFFDELQPDAVILCPSTNDQHSTATILPNGSPWRNGLLVDLFGDPHCVTYKVRYLDSHRFRQRWATVFRQLATTKQRLEELSVPAFTFFVAIWSPDVVHGMVQKNSLSGLYAIVPERYCLNDWALPPPLAHGTAEANALYARILYDGFAIMMGWNAAPGSTDTAEQTFFTAPPPGVDWPARTHQQLRRLTHRAIAESFQPSNKARAQCAGPIEASNGVMGRATTLLVRRGEHSAKLMVTFRRVQDSPSLYPLNVRLTIPSATAPEEKTAELFGDEREHEIVEIPIPSDIAAGSAIDVIIEADRVSSGRSTLIAQSLIVESITQELE